MTKLLPLICLVTFACYSAGCKIYTYRDTTVLVLDGETGRPIADAKVHIEAVGIFAFNLPKDIKASTNSQGLIQTRMVDNNPVWIRVAGEGYLSPDYRWTEVKRPEAWGAGQNVNLTVSSGKDGIFDRAEALIEIKLFRQPEPSLRIEVPNGYRGLVKIHLVEYPGESPLQPSRREHLIKTNTEGEASLIKSHLIWNGFDRGNRIMITDGERDYPLQRHPSGGVAASRIELYQVPGLLIHLGDENDFAENLPTVPGRRVGPLGSVKMTRLPNRSEMLQFMEGARQVEPQ